MRGYDTVEYAKSRLIETIIRLNGSPVMVLGVHGTNDSINVEYNDLINDGTYGIAKLSDCDLNPVPLGYVNHKKSSYYIMRTPMRRDWRQGLRMLNLVDAEGAQPRLVSYASIGQTILGKFPSFKETLGMLSSKGRYPIKSLAFHRDFAIDVEGKMEYKGFVDAARINMDNGSVTMNDNTNWLAEAFDEAMENAA